MWREYELGKEAASPDYAQPPPAGNHLECRGVGGESDGKHERKSAAYAPAGETTWEAEIWWEHGTVGRCGGGGGEADLCERDLRAPYSPAREKAAELSISLLFSFATQAER